ncbi:MAG: threonylcarbamoyl-AMP synthase [Clostridiales bacterium]|nr:threonylcarbamoyl-AMP synthase [Clostridiales bacterium]
MSDIKRDSDLILRAGELIASGGIVAIPTETVYGLGANALNPKAVAKVFEAKGRPSDNPFIVHICERRQLSELCHHVPAEAAALAERLWPGPLTLVLPRKSHIPDIVTAGLDTVGIRFPSHPIARAIIKASGVPVAAPSANLSGRPSTTSFAHTFEDLNGRVDAIVDGGDAYAGVESTVISVKKGSIRLLRPGVITLEDISQALSEQGIERCEIILDEALRRKLTADERPRAPGMKYRHYAPRAPVTAFTGAPALTAEEIRRRCGGREHMAVLCFDEYRDMFKNAVSYGSKNDMAAQAHNLFDALRRFDEMEGVEEILAQCPSDEGVGLAVANRLKKAAGFNVVEVGKEQTLFWER